MTRVWVRCVGRGRRCLSTLSSTGKNTSEHSGGPPRIMVISPERVVGKRLRFLWGADSDEHVAERNKNLCDVAHRGKTLDPWTPEMAPHWVCFTLCHQITGWIKQITGHWKCLHHVFFLVELKVTTKVWFAVRILLILYVKIIVNTRFSLLGCLHFFSCVLLFLCLI